MFVTAKPETMQLTVTTLINGHVVDEVNCTAFNEESLVNEKQQYYKIEVLQAVGVDAGVYVNRESKMNEPDFEERAAASVGLVDLIR